jgi:DNA repair protein RadC
MFKSYYLIKEIDISYSYGQTKAKRKYIKSSLDAKNIFLSCIDKTIEHRESFLLLILNNSNEILGIKKISEGGLTATIVDVRLIFQTILKANGTAFIVCHNHPSGKLQPSQADKNITQKIKQGANLLDLTLLDHLILTKDEVLSFADENIL